MTVDIENSEIIEGVKSFIRREIKPRAVQIESSDTFPQDVLDKMAELGIFGMTVPEAYGGIELPLSQHTAIMEELAAGWSSLPSFLNSHCTVTHILTKFGTEQQKQEYLPKLADGSVRGAIALTEPGAGSDLKAVRTTAKRNKSGGFTLSGNKIWITNGMRAGVLLVLARVIDSKAKTQDNAPDNGISLFLLEQGTPGFEITRLADKMGFKHVDTAEMVFADVALPAEALVGEVPGKGLGQLYSVLENGRIAMASTAVGVARSALDTALSYSQEREAFGVKISQHQAVQMHLANMATKLMAARSLVREAAARKETNGRADMMASMAKLFASEAAMDITRDAMRVLGGYGYVAEFPIERLYREAPLYVLTEGTNEIQHGIIARAMLADDGPDILGLR